MKKIFMEKKIKSGIEALKEIKVFVLLALYLFIKL